jgi:hypothetical protein
MAYSTTLSASVLASALAGSGAGTLLQLRTAKAQGWLAFLNGALVGSGFETSHSGGDLTMNLSLNGTALRAAADAAVPAVLTLLSASLGIDNGAFVRNGVTPGTFSSSAYKGITSFTHGAVVLGGVDLTAAGWVMQSGVTGEARRVFTPAGLVNASWAPAPDAPPPMSWLYTRFPSPPAAVMAALLPAAAGGAGEVTASLNLDVTGLGFGRLFLNGFDLGRYWSKACGRTEMCQRYYSLPADLLAPAGGDNLLVLFDAAGAPAVGGAALVLSQIVSATAGGAAAAATAALA